MVVRLASLLDVTLRTDRCMLPTETACVMTRCPLLGEKLVGDYVFLCEARTWWFLVGA